MPTVSLIHKNLHFEVEEEKILFDALDNQGEKLPHGCLAGSCGACKIEVIVGEENLKPPSPVEQNTIESIKEYYEAKNGKGSMNGRVVRLSCRARVRGDVSFRPFK